MKNLPLKHLFTGLAMLAGAGLAIALTPTHSTVDQGPKPNLETLVPEAFGEWKMDETVVPITVSPEVAQTLSILYDQTLSRTYEDAEGNRIMLSLAYGGNQSRALQVHKPEVCYTAQGFTVSGLVKQDLSLKSVHVPVMRLVGQQGERVEPITYWIRIGDDIARGWIEQNKYRFLYGLAGKVPDGLLFRVSNISPDTGTSYQLHDQFIRDMLEAMSADAQKMLIGIRQKS